MVVVEVLDPKARRHKDLIETAAHCLLEKGLSRRTYLPAGRAFAKADLSRRTSAKADDFYLEIYLVGGDFMNKNVLAFPAPVDFPRPDLKQSPLGEIYLNPQYIKNHGEDLVYMLIHGFLHLLGYNHIKKSDRIAMEGKERELLELLSECRTTLSGSTSGLVRSRRR